jgi:hypothetical protein
MKIKKSKLTEINISTVSLIYRYSSQKHLYSIEELKDFISK